jgi:hypothetical protein
LLFGCWRFRVGLGEPNAHSAIWRLQRIAKERLFPAIFMRSALSVSSLKKLGWRRSADRTRLREKTLLTGNFTGKIPILGLQETISEQETSVP